MAKHARASSVAVEVEALDGGLRHCVRDDGVGGADLGRGSGLVGLKDRAEALGGRIAVESARGAGTAVRAELPLSDERDAQGRSISGGERDALEARPDVTLTPDFEAVILASMTTGSRSLTVPQEPWRPPNPEERRWN